MYRVEFIGLPGSGKSTIRKKIVDRLKRSYDDRFMLVEEALLHASIRNIDKLYKIILNFLPKGIALKIIERVFNSSLMQFEAQNRFLAKFSKPFECFLSSVEFAEMSVKERESVIAGYILTGSIYESINEEFTEDNVIFFEEGFIQKSFMFISPYSKIKKDSQSIFSYLNNIPLPNFVIYVHADVVTCYQRMIKRPEGLTTRLKNADDKTINAFLIEAKAHLDKVANWLKKKKSINLLELNNNKSIDNVIDNLISDFDSLCG